MSESNGGVLGGAEHFVNDLLAQARGKREQLATERERRQAAVKAVDEQLHRLDKIIRAGEDQQRVTSTKPKPKKKGGVSDVKVQAVLDWVRENAPDREFTAKEVRDGLGWNQQNSSIYDVLGVLREREIVRQARADGLLRFYRLYDEAREEATVGG